MPPTEACHCCQRVPDASRLEYRRGERTIRNGALLQCDLCERPACADCLGVYDILSGYDFLCHDCARAVDPSRLRAASAQNQPARPFETKELAGSQATTPVRRRGTLDT